MRNNSNPSTTGDGTRLLASPALQRVSATLQDSIIEAYERSTNRLGKSLALVRFQYAYDEKNEGRCCTHYDVLVKDLDLNENVPLILTIAVNPPQFGGL